MSDASTIIPAAPAVAALAPIVQTIVATVVSGAVTFGVALFTRWTGVAVQTAYTDALRKAAQTEAGALVAEAADNLSSRSILVTSPVVAAAAERIAAALPEAMQALGMTPEALSRLVAGEIGKLQAQATAIPVRQSAGLPKAS
jgi:hypothetical protein